MTETSELQEFPFPVGDPLGISVEYAERRARCPFGMVRMPTGHDAVLLTTYRDTAAALADPRLSHDLTAPGSPRMFFGPSLFDDPNNLLNMEGDKHRRIRRIVASAFTPKATARWQPVVEQAAMELIDSMRSGPRPVDLVSAYCFPLPVRIICTLLGVPAEDHDRFREWSNAFVSAAEMSTARQRQLIGEFHDYTTELVAHKRGNPGTDLIDDLIAARDGGDRLSEVEMRYMIVGLIAAGNETTANSLGRYVVTLLADDGLLWRQLAADPDLVPAALDELLRLTPLGQAAFMRVATDDVMLPSGPVRAGQAVLLPNVAAMRDETVFPDPDRVRLDREKVPTLAFGGGPHMCLGINLAVSELRTSLRVLTSELPSLRLACEVAALQFTNGDILSSVRELPVDW